MTESMAASQVVPGEPGVVFDRVLAIPLDRLFVRGYGPLPPVRSTDGPASWSTPGQRRTVHLVGPGSMIETLTEVRRPGHFGYRLTGIRGPMRAVVRGVEGRWGFAAVAGGTEITWSWRVTGHRATAWLLPVFARLWRGYADRSLRTLETLLAE